MSAHSHSTVVILDYGSQYTQLITRRVRELGIFSVILPGDATLERIQTFNPRAVILSKARPNSRKDFSRIKRRQNFPFLEFVTGCKSLHVISVEQSRVRRLASMAEWKSSATAAKNFKRG
jgi:hypothetical protein